MNNHFLLYIAYKYLTKLILKNQNYLCIHYKWDNIIAIVNAIML